MQSLNKNSWGKEVENYFKTRVNTKEALLIGKLGGNGSALYGLNWDLRVLFGNSYQHFTKYKHFTTAKLLTLAENASIQHPKHVLPHS